MRARRTDSNLKPTVVAARALGLRVNVRNDDLADLDVQYGGYHEVWEVKAEGGRYTKRQQKTRNEGWCIRLITCLEDVEEAARTMKKWQRLMQQQRF